MKFILTSCADKAAAKALAKKLVKAKFAACVSVFKANSVYFWDGEVKDEKERVLLIKTAVKFKKVAKFIAKHHDYELPEIVAFKADNTSKKYKKWIKKESK
ncbi:divalent cation tolerance protein CutA [Campylobacter showae]|jgi:cutA1 divalent ion tolerance protein|uniref:divalent cation tolerance protein CutA n=1 Tax=Campylobacter showae TaxID=204 RepID=UPI000F08A92E|nr:divalent cation tolerance protein CutA [Campylobacter showae]